MLSTASLLLVLLAQTAPDPEVAWREWRTSLGGTLPTPLALDLDLTVAMAATGLDPASAEAVMINGTVSMRYRALDLRRFHVALKCDLSFNMEGESGIMRGDGGISADGTTLRAWGELNTPELGDSLRGAMRVDQVQVEALYAQLHAAMPQLLAAAMEGAPDARLGSMLQSFYPDQLGAYFHPANYLTQADDMLVPFEFQRDGDQVRCLLGLRLDSGPLSEFFAMAMTSVGEEERGTMEGFLEFMRQMRFPLTLDAKTGVPLAGSWKSSMPLGLAEPGTAGTMNIDFSMRSTHFSTAAPAAAELAAPAEGYEWFDADPFLPMVRGMLQSLVPPPNGSEEDLDF